MFLGPLAAALPGVAAQVAPQVRFTTDVPLHLVGQTLWSRSSVNVTIACDNSTADCYLNHSADGSEVRTPGPGPRAFHTEGSHTMTGYAEPVGNPQGSYQNTLAFSIDKTPPTVTLQKGCGTSGANGWCLDTAYINASAFDGGEVGSGLGSFTCTLGTEGPACSPLCDGPCRVTTTVAGNRTFTATATDNAGNAASANAPVAIDLANPTPPTLACTVESTTWCRSFATLTNASDATSGIAATSCFVGDFVTPCDTRTFNGVGNVGFSASATDVAGRSATGSTNRNIDPYPPTLSITTTCATPGTSGWCLAGYTYEMTASDNISGLTSTGATCKLDNVVVACSGTVSAIGAHVLAVNATDVAGHENATTKTLGVDLFAPNITLALSCGVPGDAGWCKGSLTGSASATDDGGAAVTLVCQRETTTVNCASPSLTEGARTFVATATDAAGRQNQTSASYMLDGTDPVLASKLTCALPGAASWCRSAATVNISATDALSGLHSLTCFLGEIASPCEIVHAVDGQQALVGRARDVAGRFANLSFAFGVDTIVPTATIENSTSATLGSDGWYLGPVTLYFNGTDTGGSGISFREYSVDGGRWRPGNTLSALQGDHVYRARAHDLAGNIGYSPTMRVRVDNANPTVLNDNEITIRPFDDNGTTRIIFAFSEPMDRTTTEAALAGGATGWDRSWGADDLWLNFTRHDLAPGTSASVTLGTGATARHGGALSSQVTRTVVARAPMTYNVTDSTRPGGPAYSFVNITTNGTEINLYCDDCGSTLNLPFPFTFFNQTYTQANVSTNGFLTFDPNNCSGVYYPDLQWTTCAKNLVAAYWEDLDTRQGSPSNNPRRPDRILTRTIGEAPNRVFIVSWSVVHHYPQADPIVTFQIKLFEGTNDIEVHYEHVTTDGGQHMLGLVNATARRHMAYAWGDIAYDGHAVRYTTSEVSTTPRDTTPPLVNITLTPLNATGLDGWYNTSVNATLNASDADSGVVAGSLEHSLDGVTYTPGTFLSLPEGESTIRARARDNAGNLGQATLVVKRDTIAPTMLSANATLNGTLGFAQFNFSEPMHRANTEAALSGASGWTRAWSDDSRTLYVHHPDAPVGAHTIVVGLNATDRAGNAMTNTIGQTVVRAPPPPPPAQHPDAPPALTASLADLLVTLRWGTPANNGGDITGYVVSVDGGPGVSVEGNMHVVAVSRGAHHAFSVAAINSAGEGPASTTGVDVPPVSTIAIDPVPASGWYTTPPLVTLAADPSSATIVYDLGLGPQNYSAPFTVPDGARTLRWHATSNGLAEVERTRDIRVDSTPPTISGTSVTGTDTIQIAAVANDAGSGLGLVEAVVSGGGAAQRVPMTLGDDAAYHGALFVEPGTYEVSIVANDLSGNRASAGAGSFTRQAPAPPEEDRPIPLETTSGGGGGSGGQGGGSGGQDPPAPTPAPTQNGGDAGGDQLEETATDPEPDPPAIVLGDGSDMSEGVRGTIVVTLTGMPDLERLRLVLIAEDGTETLLSEGQEITEWDTTGFADGFYTLVVRRGPVVVAVGEIGIMSTHTSGDEIASERVLVRNPEAPPVEVAAVAVGAVLVTATAHAGLSAAASGATSSAAGAAGGFDPLGFAQEVAIDAGQDKLKSKTLEKDRRRKQIRSLVAAGASLVILAALWAFADTEGWNIRANFPVWLAALPIVGIAAALVVAMKYSAETAMARATGAKARVRVWVAGTVSLALSAILFRNPFGYPAYVDEIDESESRSTWKMQAGRALATIAGALAFMIPFLALSYILPWSFVSVGLLIAVTNAATTAMPFGPLPGRDVWRWNKWISIAVAVAAFAIYVGYAAALAPIWSLWLVAIGGAIAYAAALARFRRRLAARKAATVSVPIEVPIPVRDADAEQRALQGEGEGAIAGVGEGTEVAPGGSEPDHGARRKKKNGSGRRKR